MKKPIFAVALTAFSPLLWAFSTAELSQTLQKPDNVQGAFTQQRYLKSLSKPMTTNGQFVLVPKRGLLWHMQKPFDNRLRVRSGIPGAYVNQVAAAGVALVTAAL